MIETKVLKISPERIENLIYTMAQAGMRVAAMTTITDWQPLPNIPIETVLIVFQKEE